MSSDKMNMKHHNVVKTECNILIGNLLSAETKMMALKFTFSLQSSKLRTKFESDKKKFTSLELLKERFPI